MVDFLIVKLSFGIVEAGDAQLSVSFDGELIHPGPVVAIFAPLVKGIANRTRAAKVLSDLNRDNLFAKFFLNEDYVIAEIQMPAPPFVPEQLEDMLAHMSRIAVEFDEGLAERRQARVMGRSFDSSPVAMTKLPCVRRTPSTSSANKGGHHLTSPCSKPVRGAPSRPIAAIFFRSATFAAAGEFVRRWSVAITRRSRWPTRWRCGSHPA